MPGSIDIHLLRKTYCLINLTFIPSPLLLPQLVLKGPLLSKNPTHADTQAPKPYKVSIFSSHSVI